MHPFEGREDEVDMRPGLPRGDALRWCLQGRPEAGRGAGRSHDRKGARLVRALTRASVLWANYFRSDLGSRHGVPSVDHTVDLWSWEGC